MERCSVPQARGVEGEWVNVRCTYTVQVSSSSQARSQPQTQRQRQGQGPTSNWRTPVALALLAALAMALLTDSVPTPMYTSPSRTPSTAGSQPEAKARVAAEPPAPSKRRDDIDPSRVCTGPLLVAVFMMKNEAPVVRHTLESYLQQGVRAFFLYDTGSTDDTIALTRALMQEFQIADFGVAQEPFVDFSTSRNRALRLAEQHFPGACFLLMPDAEWQLEHGAELLEFCESHRASKNDPRDDIDVFDLRQQLHGLDYAATRLLRSHRGVEFVGVVHEAIPVIESDRVTVSHAAFLWNRTQYGLDKSKQRWVSDAELLRKDVEANPTSLRSLFYLGRTLSEIDQPAEALKYFIRRAALTGWDQEDFSARYEIGNCYAKLEKWPQALAAYHAAFEFRPSRAEPLIRIGQRYNALENYPTSYSYAKRAAAMPYPTDVLFVEQGAYTYDRWDLLGKVAWFVGELDEGERAVRQTLLARPDLPHLHSNLKLYTDRREREERERKKEKKKEKSKLKSQAHAAASAAPVPSPATPPPSSAQLSPATPEGRDRDL
jgi:tetratricopeptide (TPR) repeat protein